MPHALNLPHFCPQKRVAVFDAVLFHHKGITGFFFGIFNRYNHLSASVVSICNFRTFSFDLCRFRNGRDGGTADKRADERAGVAVRDVRGVHHGAGGGAHLRAHDLHVPAAQHRRRQQDGTARGADARAARLAAREHEGLHRAGLGV